MKHVGFFKCWLPVFYNTNKLPPSNPVGAAELELQSLNVKYTISVTGGGDSFTIRKDGGGYVITGGETGVLYGAFKLRSLLETGTAFTEISESPSFERRIINHWDNLDGTVERGYSGRSLFFAENEIEYDGERMLHYARLLASVGINAMAVNNVNVHPAALSLITEEKLKQLSGFAAIFRPYGVRLILSVNYASPVLLNGLDTADPFDEKVKTWWKNRMNLIYKYIPDLLGVLVKADSENQPGPFTYGRDHADGANMLAEAIAPHGGYVYWRCFVYNCKQDWRDVTTDRPKFPYQTFMPLDGRFNENVVLQIKNGPYDYQIREPVSPLLGAMKNTARAVEFQVAQEYTGQQIDLCFLPAIWRETLDTGFKVKHIAGVTNTGSDYNWTGHYLAAANLYGYGRMAWNAGISPEDIASEWCALMFESPEARSVVKNMLLKSRGIYENYSTPLGMGWFVTPGVHYGPDPLGYEFAMWGTYHKANRDAVGIDRTSSGSGFTKQYPPELTKLYDDISTCPEKLLLFFHRVPYSHVLKNGKTMLQHLYDCHFRGVEGAEELLADWESLNGKVPEEIYGGVLERLNRQRVNAIRWRDVFNTFFYRLSGVKDEQGREIYE